MNQLLYQYKKYPITISLIVICVCVYVISVLLFGLEMNTLEALHFGAFNPMIVLYNHEFYRLITANFIHFGILHLVVNCYSLYGLGLFLETTLSKLQYICVIVVSALMTTLLPFGLYMVNGFGKSTVSGGISGVIFGMIGAIGALAYFYKNIFMDVFRQLAPNVIAMLLISFIVPSISLSGHVSGMIGGILAVVLFVKRKKKSQLLN